MAPSASEGATKKARFSETRRSRSCARPTSCPGARDSDPLELKEYDGIR